MKLKWLGTAGFEIKTGNTVLLMDPFLSRNSHARPQQPIRAADMGKADAVFISHGHFDHIMDVPEIVRNTGAAVYCSETVARHLSGPRTDPKKIVAVTRDRAIFNCGPIIATAFFSSHIRFDFRLVAATLKRIHLRFFEFLPLIFNFPCGQVISWRFELEEKIIQFFGSAGSSLSGLTRMGMERIDYLLIPLQGHTHICRIGLEYVRRLNPGMVIPHHFDDFFPPISRTVDIQSFVRGVARMGDSRILVPELNQEYEL